ncbi:hypothetical protein pb186bvf_018596 [Paramecium bursaria]
MQKFSQFNMKKIQKQEYQRQPNLGNNTQSSKIRILSVSPLNTQVPLYRQHTPELSIHNQKNYTINQQSKYGNFLQQNKFNSNDLKEQKLNEQKNILETGIQNYPYNNFPPKPLVKQQNTQHRAPTRTQDQYNYIQEKKVNQTNTIKPYGGVLIDSNSSVESEKKYQDNHYIKETGKDENAIIEFKKKQSSQPQNNIVIESNYSIESEKSQKFQTTQETDIDMYESIMIEQKMNCKSCCFIIDQDAFVTTCQHTFHYNCLRDTIKRQLNNRQYNITCVCQTKFSQSLIKNLEAVLKENFFEKLILNQIEQMKVQYQPFIAGCGECKYFCIEIENPKSQIGDYAEYICPTCTKRDNSLYKTYY